MLYHNMAERQKASHSERGSPKSKFNPICFLTYLLKPIESCNIFINPFVTLVPDKIQTPSNEAPPVNTEKYVFKVLEGMNHN